MNFLAISISKATEMSWSLGFALFEFAAANQSDGSGRHHSPESPSGAEIVEGST